MRRRKNPTYLRLALIFLIFVLVLQVILLFVLDLSRPDLLLLYGGLLAGAFLFWFAIAKPRVTRLAGPGCLMQFLILLISGILGLASWLAFLFGIPGAQLAEHAAAMFTLVLLLVPITLCWLMLEGFHYEVRVASRIQRDLGFQVGAKYLDFDWLGGRKYLFLYQIQAGGLMDQAGFHLSDILMDGDSHIGFWQRLEEARGAAPIRITVASGSDSEIGSVSERPKRQISVSVPPKNYSAALEAELGFRCEVEYVKENGVWFGILVVTNLIPGGLMEKAGFQDCDILMNVGGAPHLFERLEQSRGLAPITLEVVPWLDPSDIADRPVRELILDIPSEVEGTKVDRRSLCGVEQALKKDLGFSQGWERLPNRGIWHGWPIVEQMQPNGILARAGFQEKDILLEGFSWKTRWHKARGKGPITVNVVSWMEPTPIHDRVRRQVTIAVPAWPS